MARGPTWYPTTAYPKYANYASLKALSETSLNLCLTAACQFLGYVNKPIVQLTVSLPWAMVRILSDDHDLDSPYGRHV